MARILLFSDIHWGRTTSVIRRNGIKYSVKLEHLLNTMNWVNEVAVQNNCQLMICAGDMFDKAGCIDEELTALSDIKWNDLPCYFLCGNHESSVNDLRYTTINALINKNTQDQFKIINKVCAVEDNFSQIYFIPYISEIDRLPLSDYLAQSQIEANLSKSQIIISHNDLKGINYGGIESTVGFSLDEIEQNCNLFLNGHIHNSKKVSDKILNLGSTSAHNFTNDSDIYKYGVWILDTEKSSIEFIENPYSFNFYKLEINTEADCNLLKKLKPNAVLSLKVKNDAELINKVETFISELGEKIICYRIIPIILDSDLANSESVPNSSLNDLNMDHLAEFIKFCKMNLSETDILNTELSIICS